MVVVVAFLALIVSQVPYVSADTTKTEQLIQDPNFTSSDNEKYWSFSYLGGDTQNINWWYKLYSGYARVEASSDGTSSTNGGYATIWQKFNVPDVNITNAILVIKDTTSTGGVGDAWVGVGDDVSIFPTNRWTSDEGSGTHIVNLTGLLQKYEGKSLYIMLGIHIYYGEKFYSAYVEYTNATLTITYKEKSVSSGGGGSGWSNGGSWWSGGGSWWSGGFFWWGNGGSWYGNGASGNETYIRMVAHNIEELLAIVAGAIISVLWVKVAINYFSDDPEKKERARESFLLASVGTLIIAVAVLGAMWMIAGWVAGAVG